MNASHFPLIKQSHIALLTTYLAVTSNTVQQQLVHACSIHDFDLSDCQSVRIIRKKWEVRMSADSFSYWGMTAALSTNEIGTLCQGLFHSVFLLQRGEGGGEVEITAGI
jgi:hypothetical protein